MALFLLFNLQSSLRWGNSREYGVFVFLFCFYVVVFLIQKKATATKGDIKDGVFTCLIRKNCN